MINVPGLVVLNLTTDCNMRCTYCYASAGDNQNYMSVETAIKTVQELKKINKNNSIKILFHGGEPLLCLDVIKQVIDYCEKTYLLNSVEYYIQTNCVLLDEQTIVYFQEHNVKISISLDGHNEVSNGCRILKNKSNSFSTIKHSIDLLNKHNISINCLSVLNKENFLFVEDIIDFFVENKIYNFSFNYFIKGGRGNENSHLALTNEELFEATKKIIDRLDFYYKKGIVLNERNVFYLIRNVVLNKKEYMCANSPCGAGLNIFGITPNGDIYPCDDLSSQPQFCLGNIQKQSLKEILENPIVYHFASCSYENIKECKDCQLQQYCGAGCCSRKYYENDTIYSLDPICDFYKLIIPYVQSLLNENKISKGLYRV